MNYKNIYSIQIDKIFKKSEFEEKNRKFWNKGKKIKTIYKYNKSYRLFVAQLNASFWSSNLKVNLREKNAILL